MATVLLSGHDSGNSKWSSSCKSPLRNTEAGLKKCPPPSKANTAQWTKRRPRVHAISWRLRALWAVFSSTVRRSEEHTSELQSHLNLVCRLLLEKKKKMFKDLKC